MCACEVTVSELAAECKIDEEWLKTRFEAEHSKALAESEDLQEDDWNEWDKLLDPSHKNVVHTGEKGRASINLNYIRLLSCIGCMIGHKKKKKKSQLLSRL